MTKYDELNKLNIKVKDFSIGNQKVKCPQCQPPHNPKDKPLSITFSDDGFVYNCHHCGFSGGWSDMKKGFKIPEKKYIKPEPPKEYTKNSYLTEFMKQRGISESTYEGMKIYIENGWIGFPYFDEKSELQNIKYRDGQKNFRQTANAKRVLYNYDNIYKSDCVIFCEGEMDVLSLAEVGYKYATTLPDGAGAEAKFKKDDARFKALQNSPLIAKKIILFTDNDKAGRALHKELLHRFGKDVCWYVKVPDGCKDANEVLVKHGAEKLQEIINEAVPYPIDGLYTAFDYYEQVKDLYEGNYVKPVEIGMGAIDDIYKIMTGTFHCITGIPNHGKSVFLDQVLLNLAKRHNWKFAIFSPEHSTSLHIRRLLQMMQGKAFDSGFENRMSTAELNQGLEFIQKHFYFIETRDSVPDINLILKIAKSSVLKHGIKGVIIDPYNEVSAKRQGNTREDEHIRDFISECKRFARVYESVVWVVAHPTKLPKNQDGSYMPPSAYDISGAAHWHNQADAVITVHRDFDDNTTRVITRKIREQDLYGKIGEVKYKFDLEKRKFIEWEPTDSWSDVHFN